MSSVTQDRQAAPADRRWMVLVVVGGSIGMSALSTIALTATASYLAAHHSGPLAPAIAATRGYTLAFAVSAALLGFGTILAVVLLPSRPSRSAARW